MSANDEGDFLSNVRMERMGDQDGSCHLLGVTCS
jgi:hypothetical protein